MSKVRLFLENFLVYGLGGIISHLVPLIMIPVVTRLMPSSEYFGISDLSTVLVAFATYFAILGMYDAMFRMFFEKDEEEYRKKVCSTAFLFVLANSFILFCALILGKDWLAEFFFGNAKYDYLIYIAAAGTLVSATNSIIAAPTRMQNKRRIFLVTNTAAPILAYSVSIPLLLKGHYVIALPLAAVISGAVMELSFYCLNKNWFALKLFDKQLLRQLLWIGLPLFPNFLVYWLFNSCDRVMITNMVGIGAAGIYAVGSKLGHCSQLIYVAFAGGWQYFAFSTMKEENQVKSNSLVFEYLGVISFAATAFCCALSYPIFELLFPSEYLSGYVIAPYLFLSPLLLMLFQVIANQFLVIKKTWPNMLILASGASLNVFLNLVLIPSVGIEGAAIATLLGYALSVIICVVVLLRMRLMVVSGRFMAACVIMSIFFVSWRLVFPHDFAIGIITTVGLVGLFSLLYRGEVVWIYDVCKKLTF